MEAYWEISNEISRVFYKRTLISLSCFHVFKNIAVFFDKKRFRMNFADEIKSSVREIFAELSEPAVWRGRTVDCIVSQWQNGLDLESGGFVPDASFSVKFDESGLCGELPEIGDIVSIRDAEYRIMRVSSRTGRGQIEATLVSRDK